MYKIYGSPQSSAGRCYWAAAEAGVELERVPLDFQKQEHKSEAYLKLNPNGKVPTLVDGDLVIWESMAINNYILEKNKPELFGPIDAGSHAQLLQWSYWSLVHLNRALEPLYIQRWTGPLSAEAIEKAEAEVDKWMKILEAHLVGREYLVGDTFTIADINAGSVADSAEDASIDLAPYPNVLRWLTSLRSREAYKKTYGE